MVDPKGCDGYDLSVLPERLREYPDVVEALWGLPEDLRDPFFLGGLATLEDEPRAAVRYLRGKADHAARHREHVLPGQTTTLRVELHRARPPTVIVARAPRRDRRPCGRTRPGVRRVRRTASSRAGPDDDPGEPEPPLGGHP